MQESKLNYCFFKSIRWNFLDACIYQTVLTGHYAALFFATTPAFFGMMGTLFSLVFLLATVANAGLDTTFSAFYTRVVSSRFQMRTIIMRHLGATTVIACILGMLMLLLWISLPYGMPPFSLSLALTLLGILICESIKKSLRMLLQLAFRTPIVAGIESATVVGYVGSVWLGHLCGVPLTLMHLFLPMLICWLGATLASVFFVYQLYRELPPLPTALTEPISQNLFIKNRFLNLLNQLVHQLFSSNFLVPLFALRGGFAVAGQLKLVCYISYGITSALQKIIGFSASALFAQLVGKESKNMRHAFMLVQKTLLLFLASIFLLTMVIGIGFLFFTQAPLSQQSPHLVILALIFSMQLSENFFTAFERFLIVKEQALFLTIVNGGTAAALYLTIHATGQLSLLSTLSVLLAIRICAFFVVRSYTLGQVIKNKTTPPSLKHLVYPPLIGTALFLVIRLFYKNIH